MNKLVSAIITTHNRLPLLEKAIESVFNQDYKCIECIIVDDASTDDTKDYCSSLEDIIYIRIELNESKGGNYARNIGIKNASGEYIAFLDDDDQWLPQKISKQVQHLNKYEDVGLVYCGRIMHTITKHDDTKRLSYPNIKENENFRKKILYTIPCVTSTIMVRKKLLYDIGLFDESLNFWQEYELLIRLCQSTNIGSVNECLTVYLININDKNRLTNKYREWRHTVKQIKTKHKMLYAQLSFFEKCMYKSLFYSDAKNRSSIGGNILEFYINKVKFHIYRMITIPFRFYNKYLK